MGRAAAAPTIEEEEEREIARLTDLVKQPSAIDNIAIRHAHGHLVDLKDLLRHPPDQLNYDYDNHILASALLVINTQFCADRRSLTYIRLTRFVHATRFWMIEHKVNVFLGVFARGAFEDEE